MSRNETEINFDEMAEAWQAPIVARTDIGKFSGGLLNPRTMSNLDSKGVGPGKMLFGKRVAYDVKDLIKWMKKRAELEEVHDD